VDADVFHWTDVEILVVLSASDVASR
jgi:hypothetical protein